MVIMLHQWSIKQSGMKWDSQFRKQDWIQKNETSFQIHNIAGLVILVPYSHAPKEKKSVILPFGCYILLYK